MPDPERCSAGHPGLIWTIKEDKKETHYSENGGAGVNLKEFLKHNSISTAYMQGYFLHLVVDYLFYNEYI